MIILIRSKDTVLIYARLREGGAKMVESNFLIL